MAGGNGGADVAIVGETLSSSNPHWPTRFLPKLYSRQLYMSTSTINSESGNGSQIGRERLSADSIGSSPKAAAEVIKLGFCAFGGQVEPPLIKDELSADPSFDWPAREGLAMPRRPAALCELRLVLNGLGELEIDQDEICIVTHIDTTFSDQAPNASWCVSHPGSDLFEATESLGELVQHQGEAIFDGRQTGRAFWVGQRFFTERMGCVIGRDDLDGTIQESLPEAFVIVTGFYGGVHLDQSAPLFVVIGVKKQMVRANFGRNPWLFSCD